MRVNSIFTALFKNRVVFAAALLLAILFIAPAYTERPDIRAKKVNLIIRQIGHQLLLQSGDSTSRVMPVIEVKEGTFVLKFENEFVFSHDSLLLLSKQLLPETQFPAGYTLTVHDCEKGSIVYGIQVNNTSPDILACRGRSQPKGCFTIEFTFPDLYEKEVKEKKSKKVAAVKTDLAESRQQLAELKTVDAAVTSVSASESEEVLESSNLNYLLYGGVLVLLAASFLVGRFGRRLKPVSAQVLSEVPVSPPLPVLGKFFFNAKDQCLVLGNEVVTLTDKECRVLALLHQNFGELIARETLMQEVWINEGVITGRSLDMFVSKLRKKLSRDPELRITNIHGKGYRLEMAADHAI